MLIHHCKINHFTHKYQIQGQMKMSLVYVSKAFNHAMFSTLKKSGTQLSPPETQDDIKYIHNTIKITISLFSARAQLIFYS